MSVMQWADLTDEAKCFLERCFSLYNDRPATIRFRIGDTISIQTSTMPTRSRKLVFTEATYDDIMRYTSQGTPKYVGKRRAGFKPFKWWHRLSREGDEITLQGIEVLQCSSIRKTPKTIRQIRIRTTQNRYFRPNHRTA